MTLADPRIPRLRAARGASGLALGVALGLVLIVVPGVGGTAAAQPAAAQPAASPSPSAVPWKADWGYDLSDALMSPYCPGRALSECPSPQAEELRRWILDQERAGRSRAEVEEQLHAEWGDTLRQAPRASGVGLVAYVIPGVVIALGAVLVVAFLRRQSSSSPTTTAATPAEAAPAPATRPAALDPELERELDEELRKGGDGW